MRHAVLGLIALLAFAAPQARADAPPSPALARIQRGFALMAREDYDAAAVEFTEAGKLDPGSFDAFFSLSLCDDKRNRLADERIDLMNAAARTKDSTRLSLIHFQLAAIEQKRSLPAMAAAEREEAERLAGRSEGDPLDRGRDLLARRDFDGAAAQFRAASKSAATASDAFYLLSLCDRWRNRTDDERKDLENAAAHSGGGHYLASIRARLSLIAPAADRPARRVWMNDKAWKLLFFLFVVALAFWDSSSVENGTPAAASAAERAWRIEPELRGPLPRTVVRRRWVSSTDLLLGKMTGGLVLILFLPIFFLRRPVDEASTRPLLVFVAAIAALASLGAVLGYVSRRRLVFLLRWGKAVPATAAGVFPIRAVKWNLTTGNAVFLDYEQDGKRVRKTVSVPTDVVLESGSAVTVLIHDMYPSRPLIYPAQDYSVRQ